MADRKPIQFFTYKETNMVLCDDNTVWSWEEAFVSGKETIVWKQRKELEAPGN